MNKTTCSVELLSFAQKDLKELWRFREKIVGELLTLETAPESGHFLSGNLQGVRALEFTIKGSGQFRAAYLYDEDDLICSIFAIGPHENFYDLVSKRVALIKSKVEKIRQALRKKAERKTTERKKHG